MGARSGASDGASFVKKTKLLSGVSGGVLLMTISNLIVKAAGLMFKIPLTALIGEEGMGYFNGAYTLFTWFYMLSAAGLPTAASMLIAKLPDKRRQDGAMKIFKTSLTVFTLIGLIGCLILIFASRPISNIIRVENSRLAIIAVAPTLFFVCQSAALRGYFQGFGELKWHSLSQVVEALGKVGLGVALAYHAVETGKSVPVAAAYAAVGITVGVAAGMIVLYIAFLFKKKQGGERELTPRRTLARSLIKAALPITLSSSVMSLANLIDSLIMTRSLHSVGMSQAEVAAIWGNYSSLAVPMFNLPPVLTMPIAYALLPALSSALALNKRDEALKLTSGALSQTAFIAIPCAVGLSVFSEPILSLLFADDIAARGAMLLTLLAPSSMLLCLLGVTNTVLQASGHERVPLYAMLCGALMKFVATWCLTPHLGKYATPISTFICYFTVIIISLAAIAVVTPLGKAVIFKDFLKPLVLAAVSVTFAAIVYPLAGTLVAIAVAATGYFGIAILIKKSPVSKIKTEGR